MFYREKQKVIVLSSEAETIRTCLLLASAIVDREHET